MAVEELATSLILEKPPRVTGNLVGQDGWDTTSIPRPSPVLAGGDTRTPLRKGQGAQHAVQSISGSRVEIDVSFLGFPTADITNGGEYVFSIGSADDEPAITLTMSVENTTTATFRIIGSWTHNGGGSIDGGTVSAIGAHTAALLLDENRKRITLYYDSVQIARGLMPTPAPAALPVIEMIGQPNSTQQLIQLNSVILTA